MTYNAYQQAARDLAVAALNAAITFDEHPTFNTKTRILRDLARAEGALTAVRTAEGYEDFRDPIAGIDPASFNDVVNLIAKRTTGGSQGAIRRTVVAAIKQD